MRRNSYILNADFGTGRYGDVSSGAVLRRKLPNTLLLTIDKELLLVVVVIAVGLGVVVLLIPAAEAVLLAFGADKANLTHELDEVRSIGG